MTEIRMVPWRRLALWPGNPRKRIDEGALRDLAESIRQKGVLQNVVARPLGERSSGGVPEYEVVTGQRRWRAVERLIVAGELPAHFAMPARIVDALSDHDALLLATAENVGREDMTALEEADAYRRLAEDGDSVETIAANVGRSPGTIWRRLALHRLSPRVRGAFEDGALNHGQAAAFTLGSHERQDELLDAVLRYAGDYKPARIREALIAGAPPLAWAIFETVLYDGPLTRDLFHEQSYAEDRGLFRRLQLEAAEARAADLRRIWSWAELRVGGYLPIFDFDRDGAPADSGAIVHLRDDLRVETHTGLRRRSPEIRGQRSEARTTPHPESLPRTGSAGEGGQPQRLRWSQERRLRRLQALVADNTDTALALAVTGLATGTALLGVLAVPNTPQSEELAEWLRERLGPVGPGDELHLFERLAQYTGPWLLHTLVGLVAARFHSYGKLATAVARQLGAEPLPVTAEYLEFLSRAELFDLAERWGISGDELEGLGTGELVDAILLSPTADRSRWHPPELCFQEGESS